MNERLLTIDQVAEITTLSATEIGRREKAGEFPKRAKIGPKRVVWVGSEIETWIRETIEKVRSEEQCQ